MNDFKIIYAVTVEGDLYRHRTAMRAFESIDEAKKYKLELKGSFLHRDADINIYGLQYVEESPAMIFHYDGGYDLPYEKVVGLDEMAPASDLHVGPYGVGGPGPYES